MFFELFDHIAQADIPTHDDHRAVFEVLSTLCDGAANGYRIGRQDGTYFTAVTVGDPGHWFVRTLGNAERSSLVTRLSVSRAKELAPDFVVEPAPRVFGHSRVFYRDNDDLPRLRRLVRTACEEVARADYFREL